MFELALDAAAGTIFGELRRSCGEVFRGCSCGEVFRGATTECDRVEDGAEYGLKGELAHILDAVLPERGEEEGGENWFDFW